jgi:hypothetical protein
MEAVFEREATGRVGVFLVGPDGRLLWSEGADPLTQGGIARSDLVRDFVRKPLLLTAQYSIATETGEIEMLGHVSPVEEAGWGVVIHKPVGAAFEAARRMVSRHRAAVLFPAALVVASFVPAHREHDPAATARPTRSPPETSRGGSRSAG